MGQKARIKATIDISLGLGLALLVVAFGQPFTHIMEVIMNNTSAVMAHVWCGAAFLRSLGG